MKWTWREGDSHIYDEEKHEVMSAPYTLHEGSEETGTWESYDVQAEHMRIAAASPEALYWLERAASWLRSWGNQGLEETPTSEQILEAAGIVGQAQELLDRVKREV